MTVLSVAGTAVLVLLGVSALLIVWRVLLGPSILDRVLASEVLLVTVMIGLLALMAVSGNTRTIAVVLVVSLLGFVASVSVSRYVSAQEPPRGRDGPDGAEDAQ